uniref:Chromatin target of PRMT1 protein C-terminal domain-containing protein n=3 Tax=Graphocephala atropunctata TaxID=36148 RepID=A0A1B6MIM0_9HEMI
MSLKKIYLKGKTRISLHERFTFLRTQSGGESSGTQVVRPAVYGARQAASVKNQRLTQLMDRRPSVIAALKVKKRLLKQRLGQGQQRLSIKDRLSLRGSGGLRGRVGQRGLTSGRSLTRLRGGGRGNRRPGRGNLSRSQSQTNLLIGHSMQSLNSGRYDIGSGDGVNVRGRGRFQNRNIFNRQEFRARGGRRGGFRTRGGGRFIRNQSDFRNRRGTGFGRFNNQGVRSRGFRGRGGGRRGVGMPRGRGARGPAPTKEELDSQLDQYMAGSRGVLDTELDSYMAQQESWD